MTTNTLNHLYSTPIQNGVESKRKGDLQPAWDGWFIFHHTGANMLARIQACDVNHGHRSLHVPDVPPLDLPVLAGSHHLCPRLGGGPHAAVHGFAVPQFDF